MIKTCLVCKKDFKTFSKRARYCGRECYYEMKRLRGDHVVWTDEMKQRLSKKYMGKNNPMYGKPIWSTGKKRPEITGEKHWHWKGGFWITPDGYKVIENERQTGEGREREHRMLVEKSLGRKLTKDEVVHHINGNRLDNRLENLEVMTRAEHMNIHRKEIVSGHGASKVTNLFW